MTDRQKGIIPAFTEVWHNYNSRFCGRHILQNMMSRFKVDYLTKQFWPVANSSNLQEFLEAMEAIMATSEAAYPYLIRIPLESWTVHTFDTICKTNHNTNNVVEAFNSWLNKFHALLMLTLMERVRQKFMKRIHDRIPCKHSMACITNTRDNVENYVDNYLKKAAYMKTYSNKIHAIPDENIWPEDQFETVLPPVKRSNVTHPTYNPTIFILIHVAVKVSLGEWTNINWYFGFHQLERGIQFQGMQPITCQLNLSHKGRQVYGSIRLLGNVV
ncbi:hypothetical protein Dsin_028292 [Dipteronia sinensis]|uniref:MULE transposase domain-containing protein n=1 Tax=Dipteronia sinensis TaxID=43782 RepID=A0AAD9ZRS7_9ROSI|nr:hypothetical protein Dsin_028292 [Dipteronia sinensis]